MKPCYLHEQCKQVVVARKGKKRKYLLIVANANVKGAAGSVIPPQQKFQSLQDALQEKQNVLNHPCVVVKRINETE